MATIHDMSLDDLRDFVRKAVDERLTQLLGDFETALEAETGAVLTWDEIRTEVQRHRWTPPSGATSSLDLLREDRDS